MVIRREFVYWFGDGSEEREVDLTGKLPIPKKGDRLFQKGKDWRVSNVFD